MDVLEVGHFSPKYVADKELVAGEIGYVITGLKTTSEARVGDTLWKNTRGQQPDSVQPEALQGYAKVKPVVFASIFPIDAEDYPELRDSLEKLTLNDSSLVYEAESSSALGQGFRCGFLGLLHMDIVQERLEREYNADIIVSSPSVSFKVKLSSRKGLDETKIDENGVMIVASPSELPPREFIDTILEPYVKMELVTPKEYVGPIMDLCQKNRGIQKNMTYLNADRVLLLYEIPLMEIVIEFYDKLKSLTAGYASMNYEFIDYREGDLVKLDVMVAGDVIDPLATIVHKMNAESQGRVVCKKLKDIIPKAQFTIAIQAAVGAKVLAREDISAMRKDVTAKLYGGDISRKMKLLKKQKEGKKRMKLMGKVSIPQEAFLSILKKE